MTTHDGARGDVRKRACICPPDAVMANCPAHNEWPTAPEFAHELTDGGEGYRAAAVVCPEHGEPLEVTGSRDGGMYYYSSHCPACPHVRRCGSCGKRADEAWSSGMCHGCYRERSARMKLRRRSARRPTMTERL